MNTIDAINKRRSIRKFKSDDIDNSLILDILNCGRLAPSAKNRQPWYFVITKDTIKNKIANLMIEYTNNNDDAEERKLLKCPNTANYTADVIKQASVLILIFREKDKNWIVGDNLSIGACVENMCLRATELGLGTLWIRDTVYVAEDIAEMLNHGDLELNCALAIGYSNQNSEMSTRKDLKSIVEWYK